MRKAFSGSRFEQPPLLRGLYFTSGTQEGSPIDRVLGAMSRTLRPRSASILPPAASSGKSYFINRLLHDVIFTEAGLAGGNEKKERRHGVAAPRARSRGSAALTVGLLAAWTLSYLQ